MILTGAEKRSSVTALRRPQRNHRVDGRRTARRNERGGNRHDGQDCRDAAQNERVACAASANAVDKSVRDARIAGSIPNSSALNALTPASAIAPLSTKSCRAMRATDSRRLRGR
jgi:hypothetical protein